MSEKYYINGRLIVGLEEYAKDFGMTLGQVAQACRRGAIDGELNPYDGNWYISGTCLSSKPTRPNNHTDIQTKGEEEQVKNRTHYERDAAIGAFILTTTLIYFLFYWIIGTVGFAAIFTIFLLISMLASTGGVFPTRWSAWYWAMGGFSKTVRGSIAFWIGMLFLAFITAGIYILFYLLLSLPIAESTKLMHSRIWIPLTLAGAVILYSISGNVAYNKALSKYTAEQFADDYVRETCLNTTCNLDSRARIRKVALGMRYTSNVGSVESLFRKYHWDK